MNSSNNSHPGRTATSAVTESVVLPPSGVDESDFDGLFCKTSEPLAELHDTRDDIGTFDSDASDGSIAETRFDSIVNSSIFDEDSSAAVSGTFRRTKATDESIFQPELGVETDGEGTDA